LVRTATIDLKLGIGSNPKSLYYAFFSQISKFNGFILDSSIRRDTRVPTRSYSCRSGFCSSRYRQSSAKSAQKRNVSFWGAWATATRNICPRNKMHQIYIRTYGLRNLGVSVFELENGRFSLSPTKIFRPAGSNPCRRRQHIRRQPKPVNIAVFCRKMAVYPRAFALFFDLRT
jgi:hypothetical protein